MVSLRSGSVLGSGAKDTTGEVSSTRKPRGKQFTAKKLKSGESNAAFLISPGVHTRAHGPAPDISLSTELPPLDDLAPSQLAKKLTQASSAQHPGSGRKSQRGNYAEEGSQDKAAGRLDESSDASSSERTSDSDDDTERVTSKSLQGALQQCKAGDKTRSPEIDSASNDGLEQHLDDAVQEEGASESEQAGQVSNRHSEDESDDESESEDDVMGGLAASMWAALQRQRDPTSHKNERPGRSQNARRLPANQDNGDDQGELEVSWKPSISMPLPLKASDVLPRQADMEKDLSKQLTVAPRDRKSEAKQAALSRSRDWHEMADVEITDDLKRDLRLLRLRSAMDPKRFYKRAERGKFPSKVAVGTVIEGPTEYFSGRLTKKQRKQSITEELLADQELQQSRKRRFTKLQEESQRWSHKKKKQKGKLPVSEKRAKRHKH